MGNPIFKSRAMLRVEERIGQTLEAYFQDRYRTLTQTQIAEDLGVSGATVSRWMRELEVETRFPGQRPEAIA